ncbi:MAG: hypothetical protein NXI00_24195 [Cytophagales bacterium]|nr:hypothetical protein [Cytophagales bacterium]
MIFTSSAPLLQQQMERQSEDAPARARHDPPTAAVKDNVSHVYFG